MTTTYRDPASTTRRVLLAGITLGTAVVVLAMWNGARLRIGGVPSFIGLVLGTVLLWVLLVAGTIAVVALLATFGAELARVLGQALEQLARFAGRGIRALSGRAHQWAEPRWQDRTGSSDVVTRRRKSDSDWLQPGQRRCGHCKGTGRNGDGTDACPACRGWGSAPPDPASAPLPAGTICRACGRPGTDNDPVLSDHQVHRSHAVKQQTEYQAALARVNSPQAKGQGQDAGRRLEPGDRIHNLMDDDGTLIAERGEVVRIEGDKALVRLPDGRYVRVRRVPLGERPPGTQPEAAGTATQSTSQEGTTTPMGAYDFEREEGSGRRSAGGSSRAATSTRSVPAHWHSAATATSDFHPDSDAELLDWMSQETSGILAYGEAVAEVHEHCVSGLRLDPAAMAALHDVADAAADFAEAMARAREKFRQVYEAPREFVADGGVLPKDGDWLTGDDAG